MHLYYTVDQIVSPFLIFSMDLETLVKKLSLFCEYLEFSSWCLLCIDLGGILDHTRTEQHFLKRYRDGHLGKLTFDHCN